MKKNKKVKPRPGKTVLINQDRAIMACLNKITKPVLKSFYFHRLKRLLNLSQIKSFDSKIDELRKLEMKLVKGEDKLRSEILGLK